MFLSKSLNLLHHVGNLRADARLRLLGRALYCVGLFLLEGTLSSQWLKFAFNSLQNPLFHRCVGTLVVELRKFTCGQVKHYKCGIGLGLVVIREIRVVGSVNFCKYDLISIPLLEVVH